MQMSEKEEYVEVKIPKEMVDYVQKQPWFKLYRGLNDFAVSGFRREMEVAAIKSDAK